MNYSVLIRLNGVYTIKYYHIHLHQKSTNKRKRLGKYIL